MKHKVKYLIPGFLFPEESVRELDEHSPTEAAKKAPRDAFCFTLYDIEEAPDLGPDFVVVPVAKNSSARYYLGGKIYTLTEVETMGDEHKVLLSNMRSNGWDRIIQCRTGNWQPFTDEDTLLDANG